MRMNSWNPIHLALVCGLAVVANFTNSTSLQAQSGTWTSTADALWSAPGSWSGGTVANGADNTANFNTLDIQDQTGVTGFPAVGVQLDTPRTIGHMIFGDTNAATPGAWDLFTADQVNNLLTLADATKPTITVNPLGPVGAPPAQDSARVLVSLVGTNGFTKLGSGVLALGGINTALTGTVNVTAGTVNVTAGSFDFETVTTPAVTSFNVAAGATLQSAVNIQKITAANGSTITSSSGGNAGGIGLQGTAAGGVASGVDVAPGGAVTINASWTATTSIAGVSGTGSTATINLGGAAGAPVGLTRLDRDWARTGSLAVVNFNGTNVDPVKSTIQLRPNGGAWNGNAFLNTTVNLNNTILTTAQSTGGNTVAIGALNGTASAELIASSAGVGATTYLIGALNTNAVYAGSIGLNAASVGRSVNIIKQGTGTWELSGNLTYTPGAEASNVNRRGGITRIEAGTLELTGSASLPGGITDVTLGDLFSTVDIRAGATLDVSGTTTPYSSSALQQTIGTGTIVGNYNHDQGILAPGDTNVGGNTAILTPTAGTLTFANDLSFAGSGAISYTMAPTPAGSNDRIQVNGVTNLSGSVTVTPAFPGLPLPVAGQVYTLLNSVGGFGGSTPTGWVMNWPGRGGVAPTIVTSGNNLQFTTTPIVTHSLNWSGAVDGNWNTATANWFDNDTSAAGNYVEFDSVTFSDTFNAGSPTPVVTSTVNLPGTVNPLSVTVNANATNYTIAGTGRIAGIGSLTKTGTGTLTMTTANTYTGGTTISGGIVNRDATGLFGSGPITISNAELQSRAWTATNAIVVPTGTTAKIRTLGGAGTPPDSTTVAMNFDGSFSGSGNLEIHNDTVSLAAPLVQAIDIRTNNLGFTGSISFKGASPVATRLTVPNAEGTNVAWDLGNNGSRLATLYNTAAVTTVRLGSLTGGTNSVLMGHDSGANTGPVIFEIGGLGTSTTFSGAITDGRTEVNPVNTVSLTKVGAGTLTLANMIDPNLADTRTLYSGNTRIQAGTLSIAQDYLANAADVFISAGAVLNLNTGGLTDIIDSLYLGNTPQIPGTYGAAGSGATFTSPFFTGTGILSVTTLGAPITTPGDFDNDGDVDGRDFLIWQRGGSPNGATAGDLAQWQANYGTTPLTAAVTASSTAVPEPGTMCLVTFAVLLGSTIRRRQQ
jgi:fibronectin-binding autotransporter adhesin